ncbi:PREDICTED: histone-lysine N-methyltransferase SETMAR-like [Dinoponera quadriceps]|uniref:Histone-lysine N-methyltransferase SETMAR-like n=1 Tax=Dinoponera quadriceps TaxID=609295 RepID=A0A6P3XE65_DINQU|nr:PREDICTED: histone-lysine N-methyltransferase SETMAR-like [Dinoponera quadriceps]
MQTTPKKNILFHQYSAPVHKSVKAMAKLNELRYELLPHPPYSPDSAPYDFYLFPNLKRWLRGKRFASNEEVEWETDAYFGGLETSYHLEGLKKLETRLDSVYELKGDYVEE